MSQTEDIRSECEAFIDSLRPQLEQADPEKHAAHSRRVGALTERFYRLWIAENDPESVTLDEDAILIGAAASLHDIGKCRIEADLLSNQGDLTDDQYARVKYHTIASIDILVDGSALSVLAAEIALNHHEKWDGSGYPGYDTDCPDGLVTNSEGKKGEEIPFAARLTAIVDVYDALLSPRSYKKAWEEDEAFDYIVSNKGSHFDPDLIELFVKHHEELLALRTELVANEQG